MYKFRLFSKCCVRSRRMRECTRGVFNVTGEWPEKLNRHLRLNVEKYWKDRLHDMDIKTNHQASIIFLCLSLGVKTLRTQDTSDLRHFGTGAEVSVRHFGTEVSLM